MTGRWWAAPGRVARRRDHRPGHGHQRSTPAHRVAVPLGERDGSLSMAQRAGQIEVELAVSVTRMWRSARSSHGASGPSPPGPARRRWWPRPRPPGRRRLGRGHRHHRTTPPRAPAPRPERGGGRPRAHRRSPCAALERSGDRRVEAAPRPLARRGGTAHGGPGGGRTRSARRARPAARRRSPRRGAHRRRQWSTPATSSRSSIGCSSPSSAATVRADRVAASSRLEAGHDAAVELAGSSARWSLASRRAERAVALDERRSSRPRRTRLCTSSGLPSVASATRCARDAMARIRAERRHQVGHARCGRDPGTSMTCDPGLADAAGRTCGGALVLDRRAHVTTVRQRTGWACAACSITTSRWSSSDWLSGVRPLEVVDDHHDRLRSPTRRIRPPAAPAHDVAGSSSSRARAAWSLCRSALEGHRDREVRDGQVLLARAPQHSGPEADAEGRHRPSERRLPHAGRPGQHQEARPTVQEARTGGSPPPSPSCGRSGRPPDRRAPSRNLPVARAPPGGAERSVPTPKGGAPSAPSDRGPP